MKKMIGLAALLLALPGLQACGSSEAAEETPPMPQLVVLHAGQDKSPVDGSLVDLDMNVGKGHRVFGSQAAYEHALRLYTNKAPSAVDFAQSRVLLVDMGIRGTGGYGVEATKVVDHTDHVLVNVLYKRFGKGCMVPDAVTNPFQFVQITTTKEVLIQEQLQVEDCT